MKAKLTDTERFLKAKNKVAKLKGFYIHLCAYIVVLCLVIYNYIIIEENEYMNSIIWMNTAIMVVWGAVITVQGWVTFKGPILFGKNWEKRKIKKLLEEEHQMWE